MIKNETILDYIHYQLLDNSKSIYANFVVFKELFISFLEFKNRYVVQFYLNCYKTD